jgi:hypothetical protein
LELDSGHPQTPKSNPIDLTKDENKYQNMRQSLFPQPAKDQESHIKPRFVPKTGIHSPAGPIGRLLETPLHHVGISARCSKTDVAQRMCSAAISKVDITHLIRLLSRTGGGACKFEKDLGHILRPGPLRGAHCPPEKCLRLVTISLLSIYVNPGFCTVGFTSLPPLCSVYLVLRC